MGIRRPKMGRADRGAGSLRRRRRALRRDTPFGPPLARHPTRGTGNAGRTGTVHELTAATESLGPRTWAPESREPPAVGYSWILSTRACPSRAIRNHSEHRVIRHEFVPRSHESVPRVLGGPLLTCSGVVFDRPSSDPSVIGHTNTPLTWAATVPFASHDLSHTSDGALTQADWPNETMKALPSDGVLIIAAFPDPGERAQNASSVFPERSVPLQLSDASVETRWEGQVAPNVPEYVLRAALNGQDVEIRVFFG